MFSTLASLFALEPGVVYLDSASVGPLPREAEAIGQQAVASKARPWARDRGASHAVADRLRVLAADLIGASAADIAIVCAVSYGLAVARQNLPLAKDARVLVLEADHTSQHLTWQRHAERSGACLEVVPRPADGDWTAAILERLADNGRAPPALASLSATFWRDGANIDLVAVCAALRERGTRIVLDLTQSAGILELDVPALGADFAVFPAYKWLLGPYSLAFLYVAPWHQQGPPLEDNGFNRDATGRYAAGAVRFDMGERDAFVGIPTAVAALDFLARHPRTDLRERLSGLTQRLADRLVDSPLFCLPAPHRSPHILGLRGAPEGIATACKRDGVHLTQRDGELRVSPHLFNTEADIDSCAEVLLRHLSGR